MFRCSFSLHSSQVAMASRFEPVWQTDRQKLCVYQNKMCFITARLKYIEHYGLWKHHLKYHRTLFPILLKMWAIKKGIRLKQNKPWHRNDRTRADFGAQPFLNTVLMHKLQTAGAFTGFNQRVWTRLLAHLTDPAQISLLLIRILQ